MKKFICLILVMILSISAGFGFYYWNVIDTDVNYENIWKTNRVLPENLALNAYLAGNIAKKEHRIPQALEAYKKVLDKDPDQANLLKDFYVLSMFQGSAEMVLPYLDKIPNTLRQTLFVDYLKAAHLFQQNSNELLTFLQKKNNQKADMVILPLIRSWYAAQINDKKSATESLKTLQGNQMNYILGYHEFLLGNYFDDEDLKEKGFKKIQDKKLPAIGFFPLLKEYAQKKGKWKKTPLYQQFQKMEKIYPATAELIQGFGQTKVTPTTGLAESFYFLAAEGTSGLFSKEEAVFLNSIALLLEPQKDLALIWGAELNQSFNFPYVAIGYYEKISQKSATLLFKEASVLLLDNQNEKAEKIMQELQKTNPTHIPLLTLMGQSYLASHQNQKALNIYNQLIPLLEQNPQNKPLAEAYVARANLYQQDHQEEKMLSDLQRAQILMPEDAMLQTDIGYHYVEIGQIDEGFELIQKAYQKKPQDAYILDSLAFAYYKKNQPQTALPFAEKALSILPQSALINMHLGDIYQANGRLREAKYQYKKALDLKEDLTPELKEQIQKRINAGL